jgi:hypothetical protein
MNRLLKNWYTLALIVLPLGVMIVTTASAIIDWNQPDEQKTIRLVKESKSRKENFTVQQHLYATVYYRKEQGEAIAITGWQLEPDTASAQILVSFTYTDSNGEHKALWEANLKDKKVTPKNKEAASLSWQ